MTKSNQQPQGALVSYASYGSAMVLPMTLTWAEVLHSHQAGQLLLLSLRAGPTSWPGHPQADQLHHAVLTVHCQRIAACPLLHCCKGQLLEGSICGIAQASPTVGAQAAGHSCQPASVGMSWRGRRRPSAQPHSTPAQLTLASVS
ncbi:hypothetical protein HaLaN_10293, partial [Haematococcus lacustris]